jgi:hypothetical protein
MTNGEQRRELRAVYRVGGSAKVPVCIFGGSGAENREATLRALCRTDPGWYCELTRPPFSAGILVSVAFDDAVIPFERLP